jgi:uncharacterized protein YndB with AHSA1/START domain
MALTFPSDLPSPPPDLPEPTRRGIVLAVGVTAAVILYCSARALCKSYSEAFFCSPFFVGAIVGVLAPARPIHNSFVTLFVALLASILLLQEGVVCVLFALPLVIPETILGALSGATIRRYVHHRQLRMSIAGGLMLVAVGWQAVDGALDDPARHPLHHAESAIVIDAPPDRVFAAIAGPSLTIAPRWQWFLRIGLPMPTRLDIEQPALGGDVRATFSHGVARGHITEWRPRRALAYSIDAYDIDDLPFHITRLGRGPHYGLATERVDNWLTLVGTRYDLEATADGRTRLRRNISWRRHLAPGFYFGWLQDQIITRGQDRLLELIRARIAAPDAVPDRGEAPALATLPGL